MSFLKYIHDTDWATIEDITNTVKIPAGGYVLTIKEIKDIDIDEYLNVEYFVSEGDYKGNVGVFRQYYRSENNQKYIKNFFSSLIKSNNPNLTDEQVNEKIKTLDISKIKNLNIGSVFREEEYIKDNKIKTSTKPFYFCTVETIRKGDFRVPDMKKISDDEREKLEFLECKPTDDDLPF